MNKFGWLEVLKSCNDDLRVLMDLPGLDSCWVSTARIRERLNLGHATLTSTSTSTSTPTPTATATLRDLADALAAQRGTLAALFAEVDADGSVSLDKEELRDMITHRLGVNLADEEMGTVWRQLDADGSVRRACLLL